jgi:hypothetical protein
LSNTTLLKFSTPIRIPNFSPIEKAEAAAYAQSVYDECFESGSFSKEEMYDYLVDNGLWTEEKEVEYNKSFEDLQQMKVDYFEAFSLETRRNRIKGAILAKMGKINDLHGEKSYLSEYTCDYARDEAYGVYLFKDTNSPFSFYRKFVSAKIQEDVVRGMYFDSTWRTIWNVSKDPIAIFGMNLNWLNDSQLLLLYWSKVYDNIAESSEVPSHAVMKDPLAIDGWLIKQSKNREAEDKKKALPSNNAGEVFVMAGSKKEIVEINNLNSLEGKQVLKSRAKDLKTKGELDEGQFSHVKQELNMKKNELSFRGK